MQLHREQSRFVQLFEQLLLHAPHPAPLSASLLVVITNEMQNTMNEQKGHLLIKPRRPAGSLPQRRFS